MSGVDGLSAQAPREEVQDDGTVMTRGTPPLDLGGAGKPWITKKDSGWSAGVHLRLPSGRRRQVTASGPTKGVAERRLAAKVASLTDTSANGVQPDWTVAGLCRHWLAHKTRAGHSRRGTPLKPQTLWNFTDTVERLIVPAAGQLRVREATVPVLKHLLNGLEDSGLSTRQIRTVLSQAMALAVRDGAVPLNPVEVLSVPAREKREVGALDVPSARRLLTIVHPDHLRRPGVRGPNGDLHDAVLLALATGGRVGELLALTARDVDLDGPSPTVNIAATLIEPRKGHISKHTRQESTKSSQTRALILPDAAVEVVSRPLASNRVLGSDAPVLASRTGTHLWAANLRMRLRAAVAEDPVLKGTTMHTLRRTVASLVAYSDGSKPRAGNSATRSPGRRPSPRT